VCFASGPGYRYIRKKQNSIDFFKKERMMKK